MTSSIAIVLLLIAASSQLPPQYAEHLLAVDPDSGSALLLGMGESKTTGAAWHVWQRRNGEWKQIEFGISTPDPRWQAAVVYDRAREVFIVFGGWKSAGEAVHRSAANTASVLTNDMWEFNGTTWTSFEGLRPPPRAMHSMIYDPVRKVTVLYGGRGGSESHTRLSDTWEFDGTTWTKIEAEGPPPRYEAAMAYDETNQRIVLFGGYTIPQGYDNATWVYENQSWRELIPTNFGDSGPSEIFPVRRFSAAMTYDTLRNRLVLYGGFVAPGDTWELADDRWRLRNTLHDAGIRRDHSLVFDPRISSVVIYGGSIDERDNARDGRTWFRLTDEGWEAIDERP